MDDGCAYGDRTCPCQDGDLCHYVDAPGSPAMQPPTIDGVRLTPGDRLLIRQGPFTWGAWLRFVVRRPWRVRTAYRAWKRREEQSELNGIYEIKSSGWTRPPEMK